jgi:hypothetical protein
MSGQSLGSIVGTVVGSYFGPVGAAIGGAIGGAVGSSFDTLPTQYGPRLDDLRPQTSEYGKPIPIVYGTVGMGGNVIWASDYIEVKNETEQGGKGGPSQKSVTFSYLGNFAVLLAEGPATVGRIWAGPSKRLIYDGMLIEGGTVRIYNGTENQLPDPLIESYEGVGNVPAFRGACYVVFENFPLENDGNAIPFITAEVGATASPDGPPPVPVYDQVLPAGNFNPHIATIDPLTGWVWVVEDVFYSGTVRVQVINDRTQELIREWNLSSPLGPVISKGVSAKAGIVWLMFEPYVLAMRRGLVASFTSGEANPDGSVKVMPTFTTWMKMGKEGSPIGNSEFLEEPMGPQAIYATTTDVWLAFDNGFGYWPISRMSFWSSIDPDLAPFSTPLPQSVYQLVAGGASTGGVYHMAGDDEIMGAARRLGGPINFTVMDIRTATVLHAVSWDIADQGKAFDYDPVRKKFIAYNGGFPGVIKTLDALTGEMEEHALSTAVGDTDPPPAAVPTAITYSKRTDRYLVGASGDGAWGSTVFIVDPDTLETQAAITYEAGALIQAPLLDPPIVKGAPYVLSFDGETLKRLYVAGLAAATPAGLGAIVADLSRRAGLTADQIDVSQLTDMVPGYAIARQTTVRAAIDALRPAYYFDGVESGSKVKFVKRGGQSVAVIENDDLDAHQADGQPGDPLMTTRQMEVELPKVVNVNYLSAATDYEKATQIYSRQVGSSEEETTLDLPLVLSDTKGQEIAQVNAHLPWVQRIKYGPFTLPRKYSALEPTDIITVKGYEMMLEKVTATPGGILTCEAVATDSSHYTPHVVVTEPVPDEKVVFVPGDTTLELM